MHFKKKIILVFVQYYLPGYVSGGPVRTIANLVERLGDEFLFKIVCLDRDMLSNVEYNGISVNSWNRVGKAYVFYASPDFCSFKNIKTLIQKIEYDVLYLNSFFSYKFSILPLFIANMLKLSRSKIILAPRGEFAKGAISLKPKRKKIFLYVANVFRLHKGITWQASANHELKDIVNVQNVASSKVVIASDLPQDPSSIILEKFCPRKKNAPLRIIFLSRICKVKNLLFLLDVVGSSEFSISVDIYGSKEDLDYWALCQRKILTLPEHIKVRDCGVIANDSVCSTVSNYDLFFLPTLGENFGHAIYEAFSSGTPVLISDRTPWRSLKEKGIGWDVPLENKQLYCDALETQFRLDRAEQLNQRKKVLEYAKSVYLDSRQVDDNRRLFLN